MSRRSAAVLRRPAFIALLASLLTLLPLQVPTSSALPSVLPAPSNIAVSTRATVAVVSWSAPREVPRFRVQVTTADAALVLSQEASGSLAVVTGLRPGVDYLAQVTPLDSDGTAGTPSQPVKFLTSFAASAPVVSLDSPTSSSVEVSWDGSDKDRYEVAWFLAGETSGRPLGTTRTKGTSFTIGQLSPDKSYAVRVRLLDAQSKPVSDWSEPATVTVRAVRPLVVATFNIKCANCSGGQSWASRRGAVAATILGQSPDVVGLQEASQGKMKGRSISQVQDLLNALGGTYRVLKGPAPRSAVSILYNPKRIKVNQSGLTTLPRTSGMHINRYVMWAELTQVATGKAFFFSSTHLEPQLSASIRVRQAQAVVANVRAHNRKGLPSIVVGDFNSHKWTAGGNRPRNVMLGAGYVDPLGNSDRSMGSTPNATVERRIRTNFSSYNDYQRRPDRFPYINGTYLDYIFTTPMRVSEWETVVRIDSSGRFIGTIPSDHNLCRATVWLP